MPRRPFPLMKIIALQENFRKPDKKFSAVDLYFSSFVFQEIFNV